MRSEPTSKCSKCRHYCRTGTTSLMSHFGLCGLVVGYCIMGAFLFEFLEATNERNKRQEIMGWRSKLADSLWEVTARSTLLEERNWTREAILRLRGFEVTVVQAVRKEGYDGKEDAQLQWSFSGALLYSIIVITTIGYGNIAPKTPQGKIVTILYAIVGIPLMLLCLSNIGDVMAHSFKLTYRYICCSLCHRRRRNGSLRRTGSSRRYARHADYRMDLPHHPSDQPPHYRAHADGCASMPRRQAYDLDATSVPVITNKYALRDCEDALPAAPEYNRQHRRPRGRGQSSWRGDDNSDLADDESRGADDREGDSDDGGDSEEDDEMSVPIWLCCAIVAGYICGGAWLFYLWEGWGYLDSAYFCFVTLTTIGFGDLVPGQALSEDQQMTLAVCAVYLLFGMALLAMSFNLVQEEVTKSMKCVGRRLGILSDDDN
ncbi:potassium channel subfamily K member 18-like [Ornithodoros turicata]|uniref:potassium channel subfamily K member 18-like n=1 Tax=Ornithodoros turicata TaxID=34597 RepID=UPI003138ED59